MIARARWLLTGKTLLAGLALMGHFAHAQQMSAGVPVEKPVPGFLSADIGDHRTLRYRCAGRGTPTVLVEQGMAISVETTFSWKKPVGWAVIFPHISRVTRICVYDRVGLGRSSKPTLPATSLDTARDLHIMLDRLRIPPPYVLAGQSLGGMDALMFANTYPNAVAGMILIDSAHPDQQRRFAEVLPPRSADESAVLRGFRDGPDAPVMGEWFDFPNNSKLMQNLQGLGHKPLIVLTRDPQAIAPGGLVPAQWEELIEPVWQQLQAQLATLSTNSKHIVVEHAGHNIQFEQPQVVVSAILDIVQQVRQGTESR
ncbi:MAG: alpha/beta fold hydrolase [Steroidobacteraceae bacterium]